MVKPNSGPLLQYEHEAEHKFVAVDACDC